MKVSIHQPQYFPWMPYFKKIEESDIFIFLDSVDFQKNGLQNRNQIKTNAGKHWLTVPIIHNYGQKIMDTKIVTKSGWQKKHWKTILHNYGRAGSFKKYENDLEKLFSIEWKNLSDLNIYLTDLMLGWLGIKTITRKSSELNINGSGSDLILSICRELNATRYITGTGALDYLDKKSFEEEGISVQIRGGELPKKYPQQHPEVGFLRDLSALDLVLNCGDSWRRF